MVTAVLQSPLGLFDPKIMMSHNKSQPNEALFMSGRSVLLTRTE